MIKLFFITVLITNVYGWAFDELEDQQEKDPKYH